jgi:hypothetical protein
MTQPGAGRMGTQGVSPAGVTNLGAVAVETAASLRRYRLSPWRFRIVVADSALCLLQQFL